MPEPLLVHHAQPNTDILIREARVLDPRAGIDEARDVLLRDGEIAELGAAGTLTAPDGAEVVDSPQAVITAQVAAGVVVRMAVLYEVLAHVPSTTRTPEGVPA